MRIIAGHHKGIRIRIPKNLPVRPTTDRAKSALFSILNHKIEVLKQEEEASLVFLGLLSNFNISDGLIADLGGGSLELIHVRNRKPLPFLLLIYAFCQGAGGVIHTDKPNTHGERMQGGWASRGDTEAKQSSQT